MNTLLWEVLKDVTHRGQTQKPARTDEVCRINGTGSRGCWEGSKCYCSPLTSSMSDLLTDLTGGLGLQMCGQVMQVITIGGQMLQYVIQPSSRLGTINNPIEIDWMLPPLPWQQQTHYWSRCHVLLYLSVLWRLRGAVWRQCSKCRFADVTRKMSAVTLTQHFTQCPSKNCHNGATKNVCKVSENWLLLRKPPNSRNKIDSISFTVSRLYSCTDSAILKGQNKASVWNVCILSSALCHVQIVGKLQVNQFRPDL